MPELNEQIERLRKRHRASPDSKAFAPLADLLRQDGQVEEALGLLEDGLSRYPGYLTAMVILGHTLLDANRPDHARKVLARVLDLDPENFVALGLLARDACRQEIWNLAIPWLERLVILEPEAPAWPDLLEKARLGLGDTPGPPSAATEDANGYATMTMVDIYMEQGYHAKALAALKLIQAREPGRQDVKARLMEVLARLDQEGGSASRENGETEPAAGEGPSRRRLDMAARRAKEKQLFAEWLDGFQPGEGGGN